MKLHHLSRGSGRPLVLLHGLLGVSNNLLPLADSLASSFEVLIPDLRNHGRSPHSPEASVEAMALDVLELLRDAGIAQAGIYGHSLGGRVAMRLALEHPASVAALAVGDMGLRDAGKLFPEVFSALQKLDLRLLKSRAEADQSLSASLPDPGLRAFLLANLLPKEGGWEWRMNVEALAKAELGAETKAPAPYAGPAFFLSGGKSDYLREDERPRILDLFPKAEFKILPLAGHWLHVDDLKGCSQALSSFFSRSLHSPSPS